MTDLFSFALLCPDREVFSGQAVHVVAPGVEGEFGVLPGHCAFVSTLNDGVVRILDESDREVRRFCVRGGFAEVSDDQMVVLADDAIDVAQIDADDAAERLRDADRHDRGWLELLASEAGKAAVV